MTKYDILEHNGEKRTIAEWSLLKGLSVDCIKGRINLGWSIAKTLETKVPKRKIKPCLTCEWWKPMTGYGESGLCACHLYLETLRHQGLNEEKTSCSTWEARTGKSKKKQRPM